MPRELAALQDSLAGEQSVDAKQALEEVIAHKEVQWAALQKLQAVMGQAPLRLESTLAIIGAIYTQVRLLEAKDAHSSRRAQQVHADIADQMHILADIIAAMDEVYGET